MFVLHFCGFKRIYVVDNEKGFLSTLQEQCKVNNVSCEQSDKIVDNNGKNIFVIMEGSSDFIVSQLNYLTQRYRTQATFNNLRVCLLFTERVGVFKFGMKALWVRIGHHKDTGGATTTMTQVALIPKESWRKTEEESQKWFLADFLKPTVRGK